MLSDSASAPNDARPEEVETSRSASGTTSSVSSADAPPLGTPSSTASRLPLEHRRPLDPETREILRFELNSALLHFTQAERPVVLEGFGIIRPFRRKQVRTHHFGDWGIVREETLQSLEFEKCEDTAGLNLSNYSRLVDTRELVQSIYSRLPLPLQLRWSERELRRLLIDFIREVRSEVVQLGFSDQLRGVGQLFALHNRQGLSASDWFAGADIFMVPRQTRPLSLGTAQRFSRPVLENAWELWSAFLGAPVKKGILPLSATLKSLGFPESVLSDFRISIDTLQFALFLDPPEGDLPPAHTVGKKEREAVFVTDGLRSACLHGNARQKLRHELVVRVPLSALGLYGLGEAELRGASLSAPAELPSFVGCLLAAGTLLLASDRMNPLRANAALSLGRSITGKADSKLRSLLLTSCATFALQQLAFDGPFNYATVVGLASDEASLLAARGRDHLFSILDSRGLGQTTQPHRSSTLTRGYVELRKERPNVPGSNAPSSAAASSSGIRRETTTNLSESGAGVNSPAGSLSPGRFSPSAIARTKSFAPQGNGAAQGRISQTPPSQGQLLQGKVPSSNIASVGVGGVVISSKAPPAIPSTIGNSDDVGQDAESNDDTSSESASKSSVSKNSASVTERTAVSSRASLVRPKDAEQPYTAASPSSAAGIPRAD